MDTHALRLAGEDWCWCEPRKNETFCGDDLIALAVDCRRQQRWPSAPLTDEDVAVMLRVAPAGLRIENGCYVAFGACQDRALRFVLSLNA